MEQKFSRQPVKINSASKFALEFEVENYLDYRGSRFVQRFDANSYLYITKAMDYFDLSGEKLFSKGVPPEIRFLIIAFESDWLYPAYQSKEMVKVLKSHRLDAIYCEIPSTYGHDAFLVEQKEQTHLIRHFLEKTAHG